MFRTLVTWIRLVLPPDWAILLFLGAYLALHALHVWVEAAFAIRDPTILGTRDLIVVAAVIAYAVFRVVAFHPLTVRDYRQWLERGSWTAHKPLPLGPVHLVPQDALTLLFLVFLFDGEWLVWPRLFILFAFLLVYLGTLSVCLWVTDLPANSYAVAWASSLAVWLSHEMPLSLAVLAVAYAIALVGLRSSLVSFPRWTWRRWQLFDRLFENSTQARRQRSLGWPFDLLHPQRPLQGIGFAEALTLSLVAGWWVYMLAASVGGPGGQMLAMMVHCLIVVAALNARMRLYSPYYEPPINLWGRIGTWRWILPGYDRVVVAPWLVLLGWFAAWKLGPRFGVPFEISMPITAAAALLIVLVAGPSLPEWRLTGYHRIVPRGSKQADLIEL